MSVKFATIKKKAEKEEGKKGVKIYPFKTEKYLEVCRYSPRLTISELENHDKRGIYWGNMKLFIFLLEFIERYFDLSTTISTKNDDGSYSLKKNNVYCCYVGAAPGVSIALAATLYPEAEFYLYDPYGGEENKAHEKFDHSLRELPNVKLFERYFTDEDVETWKEVRMSLITPSGLELPKDEFNSVYFISDIRSREISSKDEILGDKEKLLEREKVILDDMTLQRKWIEKINPHRASLKFRPNHTSITGERRFTYLDGIIYTQCFEKEDSYETRLVVRDNITTLDYDVVAYEEALNYHNAIFRGEMLFFNPLNGGRNPVAPSIGLGRDYDSCRFVLSVRGYLYSRNEDFTEEDVIKVCDFIIKYLSSRDYGGKGQKDLSERRSRASSRGSRRT